MEDRGAQAAPEQNPGAQSLAEQDHGAQSLAEQDHGAQSLVEQDQSAQRAPEPENGEMREAEPEDGATSGQEVSSPEAAGGYAAHVASPGTPASVPSLGSGRYRPPEDSPVAEVSAQPVVIIADDDGDAWGPWRAPPSVAADGPAEQAGGVVPAEDREIKRPRRGLPSGSQVQLSAVPLPGEAEEKLLRQVFMREQERRIQEGLSLGMRLQAAEDEPLPMLSHFYGRPSSTEFNVRFIIVGVDGPGLSYQGCPGWWLARCSWRGYGDIWQGPTRSTRGVCRRNPLYAAEIGIPSKSSSGHHPS